MQVLRDLLQCRDHSRGRPGGHRHGRQCETFNVNGDTAAGAIAGALQADRLLLLTDVSGVKNADGRGDDPAYPRRGARADAHRA